MRTILGGGPYKFVAKRMVKENYRAKTSTEHSVENGDVIRTLDGQENNRWAIINHKGAIGLVPGEVIMTTGRYQKMEEKQHEQQLQLQ